MRAHVLMHVDFEGPGSMGTWFASHGYTLTHTRFYQDIPALPELSDIDVLVVMGGPMSVNDEAEFPWLVTEKRYVRAAIQAGKPVLGVCLGAQLIASVLGARVFPNKLREIGWFPVRAAEVAESDGLFAFPEQIEVFHWHGETFTIPPGATRILKSRYCENQAFAMGPHLGMQCHVEMTEAMIRLWCRVWADEKAAAGPSVQTPDQMYEHMEERIAAMRMAADRLYARWVAGLRR